MNPVITVDRLALEGEGVGRLQSERRAGKVAFVPYALRGETVEGRVTEEKKNYTRMALTRVVSPSAARVDPPCPLHFAPGRPGPSCGGCDWQQMVYPTQLEEKRLLLTEALERLGGFSGVSVEPTLASPEPWRYRNKVQVPFARRGRRVVAGFFSPGTHEIVPFEDCPVQPEPSVAMVKFIRDFAERRGWPIYDEDRHRGWLRHALVRTNRANEALVTLVGASSRFPDRAAFVAAARRAFPSIIGIHLNVQTARTNVILGREWVTLWGAHRIEERLAGLRLFSSAGSFFQVNPAAADGLVRRAMKEARLDRNAVALDVHCGVGGFALAAAQAARQAVGVEISPVAIDDARYNAGVNKVRNAQFVVSPAGRFLGDERFRWLLSSPERLVVFLDPPRAGCEPEVVRKLLRIRPKRIVYVSCNPATLARDLKELRVAYRLRSVVPVDLFPQTAHIEAIASLDRGGK